MCLDRIEELLGASSLTDDDNVSLGLHKVLERLADEPLRFDEHQFDRRRLAHINSLGCNAESIGIEERARSCLQNVYPAVTGTTLEVAQIAGRNRSNLADVVAGAATCRLHSQPLQGITDHLEGQRQDEQGQLRTTLTDARGAARSPSG